MVEENRAHDEHPSPGIYPIQFVQVGTLPDVPAPLARISTCGGMTIEVLHEVLETDPPQGRYVVVTPQQRRLGSTTGLNLLSALVSLPGHYAAKSWLMERLSRSKSEEDEDEIWAGMVRVDNIVTLLRGLLCPPGIAGEKELRKALVSYVPNHFESGPGYQLAGEPLIWLDVDVIEASVKEACLLEQQRHDALPIWERASALAARGGYLLDERYSDWAESKRREVEGYQRQAVHALHRLYLVRDDGAAEEQVLLLLRSYWQTHPTDEDVLRPLLNLLGKQERYQEAEEYYHQCVAALDEMECGKHPDSRTQDLREYLRAKQFHRSLKSISSPFPQHVSLDETQNSSFSQEALFIPDRTSLLWPSDPGNTISSRFTAWSNLPQEKSEDLAKTREVLSISLDVEIIAVALQWRLSSDSLLLLQQLAVNSIRKYDAMHKDHSDLTTKVTRRHALQAIATFPIQMYGLTSLVSEVHPIPLNELLPSCAAGITACWELRRYESDGLLTIQRILSAYLPLLENVARRSSSYQSAAALLASQGYLLVNVLAEHYGKKEQMEIAARQARFYGQSAQNVNLEVSALIRLAIKFDYEHDDRKALETYQEALALPGFHAVSPLLRGRVYAGLAGTYAYCSQTAQALSFLSQAKEMYPNEPESDPTYPFAICDGNTLALWEGLTLKHTDNYTHAFNAFIRFGQLTPLPGLLELNRVEHLNYAASVAIEQRDLDTAALYLDAAEEVAWQIQDAMRLSEVRDSLRSMRLLWPHEAKVKILQEKLYRQ